MKSKIFKELWRVVQKYVYNAYILIWMGTRVSWSVVG